MSKIAKNIEVPVSQGTVSKSVKDTQDQPGSGSQQEDDKIQEPGFFPDPSKEIEQYQACMKDRKKDVEKPHLPVQLFREVKETIKVQKPTLQIVDHLKHL